MNKSYVKWIRENRMLVMSVITVTGLFLLDYQGYVSIQENKQVLVISIFTLSIVFVAWILDVFTKKKGKRVNTHDFKLAMTNDMQTQECHFMLRVSSSPIPAAEFQERFTEMIEQRDYWDWSFYLKSGSDKLNNLMITEINELYLSSPIATSTFGIIENNFYHSQNLLFTGVIRFERNPPDFIAHPWEINTNGFQKLQPLKAYEYSYFATRERDGIKLSQCKLYDSVPVVTRMMNKLLRRLDDADKRLWHVASESEWSSLNKDLIKKDISDELMTRNPISFRTLTWTSLWSWMADQNKAVLLLALIGYMLSPFSPYNDLIVNIIPSYFLAIYTADIFHLDISSMTLIYYIASNILGLLLLIIVFRKLTPSFKYWPSKKQLIFGTLYIGLIFLGLTMISDLSTIPLQLEELLGLTEGLSSH